MVAVVEVEELHKSYGAVERLHGISFEVQAGEILGFLGVNGAGKTTTIEILEGYRSRDAGRVSVLGVDPAKATREWRNRIGLVLQECELDPVYTVRETVSMFARYFRRPTDIAATIASVGLTEKENDRVGRLSGGQKRRLDVALGLVGDPEVLFLDEPTTGLDPISRVSVWDMLSRLKRERDLTIVVTTHYMDEADKLCDRIAIVDHGKLVALGTPIELKHSVPGANVVEVHFDRETAEWQDRLEQLDGVTSVQAESAGFYRVLTSSGSRTTMQLVELAASLGETLTSLSVQNTTLDDVFVHYTGRQLRDEQVKPAVFTMPPRPGAQP
jgi:ABC-2 type transport system ATP-binding protein